MGTKLSQGGILEAAVNVFAKRGYEIARVEDILDAADIARRTFYRYFRSKEDVLSAVYQLATGELLAAVRAAEEHASDGDALDAIRAGMDVYLSYHLENRALLRVFVERAMRSDSPLAPIRERFREDLVTLIDAAVKRSRGVSNDRLLYIGLISALEGISLELLASKTIEADLARAKEVVHLMLDRVVGPAKK